MKTSLEGQRRLLDNVRGDEGVGWAAIHTEQLKQPVWRQWACTDNNAILKRLSGKEVGGRFFSLAQYRSELNRTKNNVVSIKSLLLDVDPNERYTDSSACVDALFKFSDDVSLPLSYVVDSGNGAHGYITLKEAIPVDDWQLLANELEAVASEKDLIIDRQVTCDAARAPRLPGTDNMKFGLPRRETQIILPKHLDDDPALYDRQSLALAFMPQEVVQAPEINHLDELESDRQIEVVRSALSSISADCDYNTCFKVITSLKSTGWEQAKDLAHEWTQKRRRYTAKKFERAWQSARPDGRLTLGTLIWHARQNGWTRHISNTRNSAYVRNSRGQVTNIAANVHTILREDPYFTGAIRYNQFSATRELCRPLGDADKSGLNRYPIPWRDADTINALAHIQKGGIIPGCTRNAVDEALILLDSHVAYHPVRQYLESLKWDGIPRLEDWLANYLNADEGEHPEYLRFVGPAVLIQGVARIYSPGAKADGVLVLEGKQGVGKSTSLRILASDPWFSDSLPRDLGSKDASQHMRGRWIFELSELSQMRKTDIEGLKAFLTREVDKYRPPYMRHEVEFPRMCIFVGTTNDDSYLKDATGNRRFLPVLCNGPIDLKKLKTDRDQIWAEAVTRYKAGEPWHTTDKKMVDILEKVQEQRTITDPWEAAIIKHLKYLQQQGGDRFVDGVTPGEILEHVLELDVSGRHKGNAQRVAQILVAHGWRKKATRHWKRGSIYISPLTT